MAWTTFQLGNTGNLRSFANQPSQINFSPDELESSVRNRRGDLFVSNRRKITDRVTVRYPYIDTDEVNTLQSILNDGSEHKELRVQDAFKIIDEKRVSSSVSLVRITRSARIGIAMEGVWLATDTGHTGTNYWTGGSFDADTFEITLGTPLASANTEVFVNYTFVGWNVKVDRIRFTSLRNSLLYTASLGFIGT